LPLLAREGNEREPARRIASALASADDRLEAAEGAGDILLRFGETDIACGAEDPGWQITFNGPLSERDCEQQMIKLTAQGTDTSGQSCEYVRIL
jgi:hypothetical protein